MSNSIVNDAAEVLRSEVPIGEKVEMLGSLAIAQTPGMHETISEWISTQATTPEKLVALKIFGKIFKDDELIAQISDVREQLAKMEVPTISEANWTNLIQLAREVGTRSFDIYRSPYQPLESIIVNESSIYMHFDLLKIREEGLDTEAMLIRY
jgi:hypothetical protein